MSGTARSEAERETESRRILERVSQEAEAGSGVAGHVTGPRRGNSGTTQTGATVGDAPEHDPIEYWGTRIGRITGLAIGIGLVLWLVVFLIRGG